MSRRAILSVFSLCLLQSAFAFEDEVKFVEGLIEEGFPKLAEKTLIRTLEKHPEAEIDASELRVRIQIVGNQFDQAAAQINSLDNAEPLWLLLAESAYAVRQFPAAESAYENYFNLITKADGSTAQAAFNYGQLLEERREDGAAKKIYEKALKLTDSRPVKTKLAALLVEVDPDRALKLAEEVQLGGIDFWFGHAVVTWSKIKMDREEWSEAQSVLETQLEILKNISDSVDRLNAPVAGARYWLGVCYEHEGKKADALIQFYNVYAKYGNSEWGPQAQEKAQALINDFEMQGKTVKIDLGSNLAKIEEGIFRVARRNFFDRQYAAAVPTYLTALNEYPEGSESVIALRELCISFIQLDDILSAKTVALYLSERFTAKPKTGDALLAAGKAALDKKQESLAWWIYNLAIEVFPMHPKMPAVLYSLAGLKKDESYLFQIVKKHPDSTYYARALGRLAWNSYEAEDFQSAAERFASYIDTETDPKKQTRAHFIYGECCRNLELWNAGLNCFQALEKSLKEASESFGISGETLKFNQPYWEKSIYYQAVFHKELGETDEAIASCDRFLEIFPQSEIVEQVRFTKAKTLIESERFAEALVALKGLDGKFAEPVCYYRGLSQYETGAYEECLQTLDKYLATWPASSFIYEVLFVQGRAFNATGRTGDAIRVFGDIMNFASDDGLMHRASLELGRAQTNPAEKLASFQRVALLADPDKHGDLIATSLFESLPLYLEIDRFDDLFADADRLTVEFPMFGKSSEIELLKTKAEQLQKELSTEITGTQRKE